MRELTETEIDEVSGGFLPIFGFGVALAGKALGSAGVYGWAISSASLILSSYSFGEYLRDQNRG
jgi:hypothetical protein